MVKHEARGKAWFCRLESSVLAMAVRVACVVAVHLRGDAFAGGA